MKETLLGYIAIDPLVQGLFLLVVVAGIIALSAARFSYDNSRASAKESYDAKRADAKDELEFYKAKAPNDMDLAKLNSETMLQKRAMDLRANPKLIEHEQVKEEKKK